jgi:Ca-activated chloride channel family protein
MTTTMAHTTDRTSSGRIVSPANALPLVGTTLEAQARGGLCRLVLRQRFHNPHEQPLGVTYALPVPEDASVSGFSFRVGDRKIVGEIDRRASARERFENAILEGRTAALLDEERSTVFSQEIGNIPPGADLDVEVEIDLLLRWLEEGQWELRIPTTLAPRYLGAEGRVPDANAVRQDIADGPTAVRASLALRIRDPLVAGRGPSSPAHRLTIVAQGEGVGVSFADEAVPLDRDVVVRWPAAQPHVGAQLTLAGKDTVPSRAFGLLTLVPPEPSASASPVARDLVLLLDTSGSMGGEPLAQAQRVACALVSSLTERDTLEMIQFSWAARHWKSKPVPMTEPMRGKAIAWLRGLSASGGTEMKEGILSSLRGVNAGSQRQVVLVTDGLIGFEQEIVSTILHKLPTGSRVHVVGVGSGVNRTLTAGASRAGRGAEVILGMGEDPEPAALRLDARTRAPVVVDLSLSGSALVGHVPSRLPDLMQGAPARVAVEVRPEGGELQVKGMTADGPWSTTLEVPPAGDGLAAVSKLFGREWVRDLEMRIAAGERGKWDEQIEEAGLTFQVATRLTSWVAVDEQVSVDPEAPVKRTRVPQQLAHGMSAEGVGLRSATAVPQGGFGMAAMACMPPMAAVYAPSALGGLFSGQAPSGPPTGAKEKRSRVASDVVPPAPASPVRRVLGAVLDYFSAEDSEAAACEPEPMASDTGAICRILEGRVVKHDDKQMVVEITVTVEALDWERPTEAKLVWTDGTSVDVQVQQGTRSGRVEAGVTLRLVLRLEGVALPHARPPAAVHVQTSAGAIAIEFG